MLVVVFFVNVFCFIPLSSPLRGEITEESEMGAEAGTEAAGPGLPPDCTDKCQGARAKRGARGGPRAPGPCPKITFFFF